MAKHKNTVWDSTAGAYVAWLTDDDYDPAGASYPGPGTYGVDTSQYRRGEIYDAVIASATDDTAVHVDTAAEISAVTEKGTPVSGDVILIEDSADSSNKKKIQVGNLPGGSGTDADAIHDNVAGEIASITAKATPTTSDYLVIEDAGDANSKKSITVGDLPASAPASHASSHDSGGGDALAIDAAAGTGSLRTLGTASTAACAGDDSRLSDSRAPTSHASSHDSGGGDAMAIDAAAGTGSLRTLGTSATAACAGNDSRLSDARTPSSHASSHDAGGGDALAIDAVAGTGSLRTLGTSSTAACAGDDSRLSDNRTDADAVHDNVSGEINAVAEKVSPVGADVLLIEDSAATYAKKKVQITNLPGGADADAIHDNVAGEIAAITAKGTPTTSDYLVIEDAADSNNKKSITLGDLPANGGAAAGGAESNLWATPDTPHANDDEFDGANMDDWSIQNLDTPAVGSISLNTVDAYDTTFNSGNAVRVSLDQRDSWALIQTPASSTGFNMYKSVTFPTNLLVVARFKRVVSRAAVNDDCAFGLTFGALNAGVPETANRVVMMACAPFSSSNRPFTQAFDSGGSSYNVHVDGGLDDGQPYYYEYVALHKIGTTYHHWVGSGQGAWVWFDELSSVGFTPDFVGFELRNTSTAAPGVSVVGLDYVRFYETDNFIL